nr:RebF-like flavin reductase [uncultured bacterium]
MVVHILGMPVESKVTDIPLQLPPVASGDHRIFMSSFPTGVSVVTALDGQRRPHGLTCTSLASVTLDPPTLLVCLNTESGTLRAIRAVRCFAVNLLHSRAQKIAETFSRPVPDRFGGVRWRLSARVRQPWLMEDAFALAGCVVRKTCIVRDHEMVLGEVCEIEYAADVPLLYGLRGFATWVAGDVQKPTDA